MRSPATKVVRPLHVVCGAIFIFFEYVAFIDLDAILVLEAGALHDLVVVPTGHNIAPLGGWRLDSGVIDAAPVGDHHANSAVPGAELDDPAHAAPPFSASSTRLAAPTLSGRVSPMLSSFSFWASGVS